MKHFEAAIHPQIAHELPFVKKKLVPLLMDKVTDALARQPYLLVLGAGGLTGLAAVTSAPFGPSSFPSALIPTLAPAVSLVVAALVAVALDFKKSQLDSKRIEKSQLFWSLGSLRQLRQMDAHLWDRLAERGLSFDDAEGATSEERVQELRRKLLRPVGQTRQGVQLPLFGAAGPQSALFVGPLESWVRGLSLALSDTEEDPEGPLSSEIEIDVVVNRVDVSRKGADMTISFSAPESGVSLRLRAFVNIEEYMTLEGSGADSRIDRVIRSGNSSQSRKPFLPCTHSEAQSIAVSMERRS